MLKQKSEPQPTAAESEPAELRSRKLSLAILLSNQVWKPPSCFLLFLRRAQLKAARAGIEPATLFNLVVQSALSNQLTQLAALKTTFLDDKSKPPK